MTLDLTNNNELTEIRILKEENCPSLSERSTLTYHIGCNERNDILFRIHSNSGTGKFNREWFSSGDVLELIYESKKPFSWKVLYPLIEGKSVNTACFLMAALKNEGLLQPLDRLYEQRSSSEFHGRMQALMAEVSPKKKSGAAKKKSVNKPSAATSEKGDK